MARFAGLLAVVIAALVACNATSTSTTGTSRPSQGLPAGWQVVSRQGTSEFAGVTKSVGEGFRIALPAHWTVGDLQREEMLEKYRAADPAGASSSSEAEALKWVDSFRLYATGTSVDADRLPAELQVRSLWIDAAVTLSKFEHDQRGAYEQNLGAVLVRSQRTQLGKHEAQVMQLRLQSGSAQLWLTAFLLVRGREVWTLEFYAPADGMDRLSSVFDEIAATFLFI